MKFLVNQNLYPKKGKRTFLPVDKNPSVRTMWRSPTKMSNDTLKSYSLIKVSYGRTQVKLNEKGCNCRHQKWIFVTLKSKMKHHTWVRQETSRRQVNPIHEILINHRPFYMYGTSFERLPSQKFQIFSYLWCYNTIETLSKCSIHVSERT